MTSRDPGIESDLELSHAALVAPFPQQRSHLQRSACRRHRSTTVRARRRLVDYLQVICRAQGFAAERPVALLGRYVWPARCEPDRRDTRRLARPGRADREPEFGDVFVPVSAAIRSSTSWSAAKRRIPVKFDIPMSR